MAQKISSESFIASTAVVHPTARIGKGTKVWHFAQVAEHAVIGDDCVIGNGAYIDRHVKVGSRVCVHNKSMIYQGVILEDDVFIGPGVCLANDSWPRSGERRELKNTSWVIHKGASIGANATILSDVSVGAKAMVGAGSVVTKNVPANTVVCGNPAKVVRKIDS